MAQNDDGSAGSAGSVIFDSGEGIVIRSYLDADAEPLARHGDNPNIRKFMRSRFPNPYTVEAGQDWIDFNSKPENQARSGPWKLEDGATGPLLPTHYAIVVNGEAVGAIGLEMGKDIYYRSAELGYWLSEDCWGKGIMSKVVPPFLQWAWDTFGILMRLNAEVSNLNLGSQVVLKRVGFVFEGRRENLIFKNGQFESASLFGLLRPT